VTVPATVTGLDSRGSMEPMSDTVETQPLTDEELSAMERLVQSDGEFNVTPTGLEAIRSVMANPCVPLSRLALLSALSELRRLRSDEWLQEAASDVGRAAIYADDWDEIEAFFILKKHRDGKA
jgi:hypothetical protein